MTFYCNNIVLTNLFDVRTFILMKVCDIGCFIQYSRRKNHRRTKNIPKYFKLSFIIVLFRKNLEIYLILVPI